MMRDVNDFESYWLLLGYDETKVEFHVGFDHWKPAQGELLIIDEIDHFVFKDPIAFNEFVDSCLLLGFTATPDDFKPAGAERNITSLFQLKRFNYIIRGGDLSLLEE